MSLKLYGYIAFLLIQSAVVVLSQSERCYFCNTEVHGQGCNDPIDPNQIQIHSCADSEIVAPETYWSKFKHFFSHESVDPQDTDVSAIRDTFPNVCISMTYTFNSRNVSARGCESDQRSTNIGILDICYYYSLIYPLGRISNFNCTVCRGNLCNHATVDGGEPDGDGDGQPGGGGDLPGNSQAVSVSMTLTVTMLLAKLFFM